MNKPFLLIKAENEQQAASIKDVLSEQNVYKNYTVLIYSGKLEVSVDGKTVSPQNQKLDYFPDVPRDRLHAVDGKHECRHWPCHPIWVVTPLVIAAIIVAFML